MRVLPPSDTRIVRGRLGSQIVWDSEKLPTTRLYADHGTAIGRNLFLAGPLWGLAGFDLRVLPRGAGGVIGRRREKGADDGKDAAVVWPRDGGLVFLLSASLESLSASVGSLAAEFGTSPPHSSDLLKLVGSATVIVVMWRWTTPKSARCRSGHRRR